MPAPRLILLACAMFALAPAAAGAQETPPPGIPNMPMTGPILPSPMPPAAGSGAPQATAAPPATGSTRSSLPGQRSMNVPDRVPVKLLARGSLTRSQLAYALTHRVQEAKQLANLATVPFGSVRLYQLSASYRGTDAGAVYLRAMLRDITVSGATAARRGVALSDVLAGNGIASSRVAGLYVAAGGVTVIAQ